MAGPSAGFHLADEDRIIPWLRPVRRGDWLGLTGGMVLVFAFLLVSPSGGRPALVPLPWDMAHHYLGALQVTLALQSGDLSQVLTEIQRADLYPPGHSLWLGAWLAVWGESTLSLQLFQGSVVLLAVCGLWMGSLVLQTKWRQVAFAFSVLFLVTTNSIMAYAWTVMLEIPALALAIWSSVAIGWTWQSPSRGRYLLCTLFTVALLLTKYNFGLPLLAVLCALGVGLFLRGEYEKSSTLLVTMVLGSLTLAIFLAWQSEGLNMAYRFAVNRDNSVGWSAWERLAWYGRQYAAGYVGHWGWAVLLVVLALCGWWRIRSPWGYAVGLYLVFTLLALSLHAYLLSRTLVVAAGLMVIPAGQGAMSLLQFLAERTKYKHLVVSLVVVVVVGAACYVNVPLTARFLQRIYPDALTSLAPVSNHLRSIFTDVESCRIFGGFNELSPSWLRLLWLQAGHADCKEIRFDLPSPLAKTRHGIDPRAVPAYRKSLLAWARENPECLVVALCLTDDSPWLSPGYRQHCQWKANYTACLDSLTQFVEISEVVFPDAGVWVKQYIINTPALSTDAACPRRSQRLLRPRHGS